MIRGSQKLEIFFFLTINVLTFVTNYKYRVVLIFNCIYLDNLYNHIIQQILDIIVIFVIASIL